MARPNCAQFGTQAARCDRPLGHRGLHRDGEFSWPGEYNGPWCAAAYDGNVCCKIKDHTTKGPGSLAHEDGLTGVTWTSDPNVTAICAASKPDHSGILCSAQAGHFGEHGNALTGDRWAAQSCNRQGPAGLRCAMAAGHSGKTHRVGQDRWSYEYEQTPQDAPPAGRDPAGCGARAALRRARAPDRHRLRAVLPTVPAHVPPRLARGHTVAQREAGRPGDPDRDGRAVHHRGEAVIYRAGWPDRRNRRVGWLWVWIGPYQIGWRIP